jgi:hypothetical protein
MDDATQQRLITLMAAGIALRFDHLCMITDGFERLGKGLVEASG